MQQIKAQSRVGPGLGFSGKVRGQKDWKRTRGLIPTLGSHLSEDTGAGWAQFITMAWPSPEAQTGTVRRAESYRHKQPSARVLTSAFP